MSKLLKNTLLYTIGNLIISLSSFLLLPLYTSYLTVADFGIVSSMQIFSSILVVFFTFAFERSLVRVYHDYGDDKKKEFVGSIFVAIILISAFVLSFCFLFHNQLNLIFTSIKFYPFFSYTIFYTFFLAIVGYCQTLFQVKQKVKSFLIVTLLLFFVTTFLNIFFIYHLKQGAFGYVKGLLYGGIVVFPVCLFLIRDEIKISLNRSMLMSAVVFSFPMFISLIASWLLNLSDRVFIDHYFSQTDVGIYSLGYKIASIVTMGGMAVSMAYNPIFYQIVNTNEDSVAKTQITKYQNSLIIVFSILTLLVIMWCDVIVKLFFPYAYLQSINVISGLCIGFLISQIAAFFNLMAYQKKKTVQVTIVTVTCAVFNIALNYFFMQHYGYYTAVFSTIASNALNLLLLFLLVKRSYYIPLNWFVVIFFVASLSVLSLLNNYFLNYKLITIISTKVVISLFFLALVYFNKEKIFGELLRRKRI
ncbi:lipopolysaccharide biosynthesis protein [Pedobacter fastidiosus]|uniref:Oligosaccharide flippase family protein n=1 Tax=Pedobacter fastidiosus TaxID=2765361 RepID=A0ABR7KR30_9SPHI|nr:oligosaccharide flippase family protein [Pedobacter fastidiosus]MBC6110550.1 oligosaccharide flippase family protein [Pedobacter fastidiosus]